MQRFTRLLLSAGIITIVVFLLTANSAIAFAAQEPENSASYPIAFQFSIRIDPLNNYWYVNVTNIGREPLAQFGVLIFGKSGYEITANSTALLGIKSLRPGTTMEFKTVCSDYYYSGAPCKFRTGQAYGISVVSWVGTCSCNHEIDISGSVLAKNLVYSIDTYPAIDLISSSRVTKTDWSFAIENMGLSPVSTSAEIFWGWIPCNNPSGCSASKSTSTEKLAAGGAVHLSLPITSPHDATKGTDAGISITGNYASFGYPKWRAQLTMSQNVIVK